MGEIKRISDLLKIDAENWQARNEEIQAWEKAQELRQKKERYQGQVPERYWSESIDTYKTDTEEKAHNAITYIIARYLRVKDFAITESFTGYLFLRIKHELFYQRKVDKIVDFVDWDSNRGAK